MTETDPFVGKTVLGRYRIVRLLAVGGMGRVYLARSEGAAGFVKPVVIKRLLPQYTSSDEIVRMFVREAKIMAGLQHPNIAAVYDFSEDSGGYVLAMEYVHGHPLSHWLKLLRDRGEPFPVEVARQITIQVLDALHYAHNLQQPDGSTVCVIHRDVTPSNVMIDMSGQVKLLDFGIARASNDATEPGEGAGKVKGKFAYIAPEIFSGDDPTPASDVYAASMMLHEVLLGKNEFWEKDLEKTVMNVLRRKPARVDAHRMDVPASLAEPIAKALEKRAEQRYRSAQAFADALRASRSITAEAARDETTRLAARDFADPKISAITGVDLSTLDRAWRAEVKGARSISLPPDDAPDVSIENVTVAARADAHRSPVDVPARTADATRDERPLRPSLLPSVRRARRMVMLLSAVALVAAGIAVGTWIAVRRTAPAAPGQTIYVEGEVNVSGQPSDPRRASNAGATPAGASQPDASVAGSTDAGSAGSLRATNQTASLADPGTGGGAGTTNAGGGQIAARPGSTGTQGATISAPTGDPSVALTRRFSRERGRVAACVESNQNDVAQRDDIQLRFTVARSGSVESVAMIPSDLGGSRFGQCVLAVARSVDFGPQVAAIVFRIPVTVRRTGGTASP